MLRDLFGLAPTDPATIALAVVLMVIVSAFAAFVPARTAPRVDPMVALRYE
jgi:ABC-type lipoprotein release transport system permease subunit